MIRRVLTATALCAALTVVVIPAGASGTSSGGDGPVASASKKKKCGKKGTKAGAAKKSKCKGNFIGKATALFAGSSFSASGCTSTTNCNRSYSYALAFCADKKYAARFELNDSITSNTFVDRFSGTWRFSAATATTATLAYTVDTWQSDAGTAQPARNQTSSIIAKSTTSFVIDGTEFTRSPGGAGC